MAFIKIYISNDLIEKKVSVEIIDTMRSDGYGLDIGDSIKYRGVSEYHYDGKIYVLFTEDGFKRYTKIFTKRVREHRISHILE